MTEGCSSVPENLSHFFPFSINSFKCFAHASAVLWTWLVLPALPTLALVAPRAARCAAPSRSPSSNPLFPLLLPLVLLITTAGWFDVRWLTVLVSLLRCWLQS